MVATVMKMSRMDVDKLLCLCQLFVLLIHPCIALDFRLGMLSPFRHVRLGWENNAAAATIAIERAQSEGILSGHNITVKWRDDGCNALKGAGNTVLLRDIDDVDVFIGPPCSGSTTPSGLLASFWNMPMFSQASSDPSLGDKTVYKTLVRLGPPFNKLGRAFVEIFNHFKWSRVVIVSRRRTDNKKVFCDYSSRAAEETFRKNNITLADWIIIDDGIGESKIDELLERIKQRGRVIIFCSENLSDRRRILIRAAQTGILDGSFVFFVPDHLPPGNVQTPWIESDEFDDEAKAAFTHVFQITVAEMAGPEVQTFRDLIPVKMAEEPWNYNHSLLSGTKGSEYSPFLHDVVYLYLLLLNETIAEGLNHRNGTLLFEKAKGKSFRGITGTVKVDQNGDREPDYWVWDLEPGGQYFNVVMEARMTTTDDQKIHFLKDIVWGTRDGRPPPDVPICGFLGELCNKETSNESTVIIVSVVLVIVIVVVVIVTIFMYRRAMLERELQQHLWKIPYNDITVTKSRLLGSISTISIHTAMSKQSSLKLDTGGIGEGQVFSAVGYYKGNTVAILKIDEGINVASMSRKDMLQLKSMKDLSHENVNSFVGLCVDDRFPCWLTFYCSKGSLQDIIGNDDIKLEWMFKMSLITDLVNVEVMKVVMLLDFLKPTARCEKNLYVRERGGSESLLKRYCNRMQIKKKMNGIQELNIYNNHLGLNYMHSSPLRYHGNLKSSNCVVDNRWVLKVTDFGMKQLRSRAKKRESEYQRLQGMFWTPPEVLGNPLTDDITSLQKADVYSFGIVMYEILQRSQPYDTVMHTPQEIVDNVKNYLSPPFRPVNANYYDGEKASISSDTPEKALTIMSQCWEDFPEKRPSFSVVKQTLLSLNKGRKLNIVDNMILMLEKYANNLEEIIEQRTSDLVEERKKSDTLLYRMLPMSIADKLKSGKEVEAEIYDAVTVYFSDIVGFTDLSARSTPIQVVDLLNDLYTMFDSIIGKHSVYKVETIGDAYMVVSGLPERIGMKHVSQIANMALDLLESIGHFHVTHCPGYQLRLRIGMHSGSCAAGIVGRTMPRYCLFGDTVNMASRMESNGEALKIHMSQTASRLLEEQGGYTIRIRGEMEIKGKGKQTTYWLLGKVNDHEEIVTN